MGDPTAHVSRLWVTLQHVLHTCRHTGCLLLSCWYLCFPSRPSAPDARLLCQKQPIFTWVSNSTHAEFMALQGSEVVFDAADLLKLAAEVPAGRCKLAQLLTCTRLGKILTAGLDNSAQVCACSQAYRVPESCLPTISMSDHHTLCFSPQPPGKGGGDHGSWYPCTESRVHHSQACVSLNAMCLSMPAF